MEQVFTKTLFGTFTSDDYKSGIWKALVLMFQYCLHISKDYYFDYSVNVI